MNAIEKLRELDKQAKEYAKAQKGNEKNIVIDLSPITEAIFELEERLARLERLPQSLRP